MTPAQLLSLPPVAAVAQQLASLDGVQVSPSALIPGNAFWVNGCEVAYLQGKVLSIRLPRDLFHRYYQQLRSDPRVSVHGAGGHWIGLRLRSVADAEWAVEMFHAVVEAHLPPPGVEPLDPPTARTRRVRRWA